MSSLIHAFNFGLIFSAQRLLIAESILIFTLLFLIEGFNFSRLPTFSFAFINARKMVVLSGVIILSQIGIVVIFDVLLFWLYLRFAVLHHGISLASQVF